MTLDEATAHLQDWLEGRINWIDNGCGTCERDKLRADLQVAMERIAICSELLGKRAERDKE